jgi:hypothetical protein
MPNVFFGVVSVNTYALPGIDMGLKVPPFSCLKHLHLQELTSAHFPGKRLRTKGGKRLQITKPQWFAPSAAVFAAKKINQSQPTARATTVAATVATVA